jgi:hypothetical protein
MPERGRQRRGRYLAARGAGAAALLAMMALGGCSTTRLTEPPQTATEELLVSAAVDHAVAELHPTLPAGSKVFVDPQYFADAALYQKYAVDAVRDQLLRQGAELVDDRKSADVIVEMRSGAQSIDHHDMLIGIPSFPIPIPLAGALNFPKIALFERNRQTGIAKLAITGYEAKDGKLVASTGPVFATSDKTEYTVLLAISWSENDLMPEPIKEEDR